MPELDTAQIEAAGRAARAEFARGYLPNLWDRVARAALTAAAQVQPEEERPPLAQALDVVGRAILGRDAISGAKAAVQALADAGLLRGPQPAPRTVTAEQRPTCRTFDDHGDSICERAAQFIVWGHLYEKRYKGPKCARHVPPGVFIPGGFGTPAIYEIPAPGITVEAPRG